jgi:ABC-2 type transport system permease protein
LRATPQERQVTPRRGIALALAYRQATVLIKNPSLFVPPMLFPLMNFIAFAGGLSRLRQVKGFDFEGGYTAFTFVFVLLQSAAFSGVFMGFNIARDFETGFARRLLIAASHRTGIIAGYALSALLRWATVAFVLTIVALLAHMQIAGGGVDVIGLYTLAALVNVAGLLWASGIALRFRSTQGSPLMQTPVFLTLFLAPVYVPLGLLQGWIHDVATVNPITYLLEAGRGFISGSPTVVALAFACGLGLVAGFSLWSFRGLRQAERAAG